MRRTRCWNARVKPHSRYRYEKHSHADRAAGVQRKLGRQRGEEGTDGASAGADVCPVEAQREEAETFVTGRTTEDASEPGALLVGKTENRDTGESAAKRSAAVDA